MTFTQFWELYPRRVAKKDAERAWAQMSDEHRFAALESLPIHVRYWNLSNTGKEFLPYPATWLNGERWTDELEMPKARRASDDWMRSTAGIQAKAAEVGINPKPGEDWMSLKARILAKVAA